MGEVNFNYIFSGLFARLGSSSISKYLSWIFFPFQAQGFLVCLWCFYPGSQDKHFCLLVSFPTALISIVDICWAFTMAFYWITPDYCKSFCCWVTFWLLSGQRFAGRFPFLPEGHSFMAVLHWLFLPRAGKVIRSSTSAIPVCCEKLAVLPLVLSLYAVVYDLGIPLCLPKPNTEVQIESSYKTMLFILF